jgi:MarR family transcriptional regulator, temperature-dependent positive regulator of motility
MPKHIPIARSAAAPEKRRSVLNSRAAIPVVHRVPTHLARRFHQVCLGAVAAVTEPAGLSPMQYAVIASLLDKPDIDQRQLAARIGVDPVTAGNLVGPLEASGLVARTVDEADRRARRLRLTARGAALRRKLQPLHASAHQRILSPLSPAEQAQLLDLLSRVIEGNAELARPGNGRRKPRRRKSPLQT